MEKTRENQTARLRPEEVWDREFFQVFSLLEDPMNRPEEKEKEETTAQGQRQKYAPGEKHQLIPTIAGKSSTDPGKEKKA